MAKEEKKDALSGLIDLPGNLFQGVGDALSAFKFGKGSRESKIAGRQIQNDQARLANALNQLKVIALTDPNNQTANVAANEIFKGMGIPVQEGADFSPFLDKFRAGAKGEQFTLSPGQARFGEEGGRIAAIPPAKQKPTPFTLSPGQGRFDPEGNLIVGIPATPTQKAKTLVGVKASELAKIIKKRDAGGELTDKEKQIFDAAFGIEKEPETVTQIRAEEIRRLQAIPEKERTKEQKSSLKKLLEGTPLVEIGLGRPAAASERTAIAETRASLDALDNLKTLFDDSQTKVGPIAGRIAPTKGLFGLTSDEQESLMAATSAFKNKVIKDITGAQMSEPEAKRIMKQIPDITDPSARWEAKYKQTKKNLATIQKRRAEVLRQSGLRVPEKQQGQEVITPKTQEEFDAIRVGTEFIDTDGIRKVKQ